MSGAVLPVAGLFGKLPAHGDFVRRGWADDTIDRLDDWLAAGLAALRARWGEEALPDRMRGAPAWMALLPGGLAGAAALFVALSPSVDRAGRFFFLAAGVAGEDRAVAGQALGGMAVRLDTAMYDAMAGLLDADALVARLCGAEPAGAAVAPAGVACCWPLGSATDAPPALTAAALDQALFDRLFDGDGR